MSESKLSRAIEMMIKTDHMHKALIDARVGKLGIHRTQHRILMHLARHDNWWKPMAFAILAIYWFNPLIWLAYILLCRDI